MLKLFYFILVLAILSSIIYKSHYHKHIIDPKAGNYLILKH